MLALSTTSNGYVFFQDLREYSMWDIFCQNCGAESLEFFLSHCLVQHTNHHVWWTIAVCFNTSASTETTQSRKKISPSERWHGEWFVHTCTEENFIHLILGFTWSYEQNVICQTYANSHSPLFQIYKDGCTNANHLMHFVSFLPFEWIVQGVLHGQVM